MLNITPINAFSDNYIWALQIGGQPQIVLVDPGQVEPVVRYLDEHNLKPVAILITHQHYDHTGGVSDLLDLYPNMSVIGPYKAPSEKKLDIDLLIPDLITYTVDEGDTVFLPEIEMKFDVISIPGHTLDHLAYVAEGIVFCGDTVFGAGCGRLFSGTPQMMAASIKKLAALPSDTKIYCSHEYTVDNLGFAKWVEPENKNIIDREVVEIARQDAGEVTLPSSVKLERQSNPFMRLREPEVKQAAEKYAGCELEEDWQVFAALREWKDKEYD